MNCKGNKGLFLCFMEASLHQISSAAGVRERSCYICNSFKAPVRGESLGTAIRQECSRSSGLAGGLYWLDLYWGSLECTVKLVGIKVPRLTRVYLHVGNDRPGMGRALGCISGDPGSAPGPPTNRLPELFLLSAYLRFKLALGPKCPMAQICLPPPKLTPSLSQPDVQLSSAPTLWRSEISSCRPWARNRFQLRLRCWFCAAGSLCRI